MISSDVLSEFFLPLMFRRIGSRGSKVCTDTCKRKKARRIAGLFCLPCLTYCVAVKLLLGSSLLGCLFSRSLFGCCLLGGSLLGCRLLGCGLLHCLLCRSLFRCGFLCCGLLGRSLLCGLDCQRSTSFG